ncbi:MAG: UvrD-helicase domain-containing protein [Oscillospiraceae bacterium]
MAWTKEQNDAIVTRGRSLIVSAAAGSGKTSVLVERLLQILSDHREEYRVHTDNIIVVTFTNEAAAQMKRRLTDKFSELILNIDSNEDPELYDWLLEQRAGLSSAKISTISSFCFDLIRENADMLGISPQFVILEPEQAVIYEQRAMQKVMEHWTKSVPEMETLFSYLCTHEDRELEGLIFKLADDLSAQAFPQIWIEQAKQACENPISLFEAFRKKFCDGMEDVIAMVKESLPYAESSMVEGFPLEENPYFRKVTGDLMGLQKRLILVKTGDMEKITALSQNEMLFGEFNGRLRKNVDKDVRAICKQICEKYESRYEQIANYYLKPLQFFHADAEVQKKLIPLLLQLTQEYREELLEEKKRENVLTFSDGEELAIALLGMLDENGNLQRTPLAVEMSKQYDLIMVDEYQDSNNKQDCLFKLLSKDAFINESGLHYGVNAFLVGDVKQSIYSFRKANPENFRRAILDSHPLAESSEGLSLIYLNHNFRSSEGVLDFINALFDAMMSKECGEVDYNENEQLNFKSPIYQDAKGLKTQVILPRLENQEMIPEDSTLEAECVAETISNMLHDKVQVMTAEGQRDCQPEDFCILLRSLKKVSQPIFKALKKRGIPVASDEDAELLTLPEIRLIWNLLKVADNPLADAPMAAVLLSPVCSLNTEDLALLRIHGINPDEKKRTRIFRQMHIIVDRNDLPEALKPLQKRCEKILQLLDKIRLLAEQYPLEECIQQIYDLTDFMSLQSLYEDDALRRHHLDAFMQEAKKYREHADLTAQSCLSGWLRYLERMRDNDSGLKLKMDAENHGCVTIKTIHAAKGLEYPFVFVANLDRKFNIQTAKSEMLTSENGLLGLYLHDRSRCLKYHTATFQYLLGDAFSRQKSEEMRLLYVALTRAKQQLFVVLHETKKLAELGILLQSAPSLAPYFAKQATCMQDWILYFLFTSKDAWKFNAVLLKDESIPNDGIYADYLEWNYHEPEKAEAPQKELISEVDTNALELMKKQLAFPHIFPKSDQPAKYSVTALSHSDIVTESIDEELDTRVSVIATTSEPKPLTAEQAKIPNLERLAEPAKERAKRLKMTERGTAVHTVMQYLNFELALQDPMSELARLEEEKLITEVQRTVLKQKQLLTFLQSPLCQRILSAQKAGYPVEKEKKIFTMIADLNLPENSPLALQYQNSDGVLIGTMDLIFRENDGWVIVDYKTNRCSAEELVERYQGQLWLYRKAAELILGEPVKQTYLYSFHLGKEIEVLK